MSKSNYVVYAEKRQIEALKATKSLEEAVELMRKRKGLMSAFWCRIACEYITKLFGLPDNEVEQLYEGKELLGTSKTTATLEKAIIILKEEKKNHEHDFGHESACEFISQLYELTFDELNRAVEGFEYWIL